MTGIESTAVQAPSSPAPLAPSEFLVFKIVCALQWASADEVCEHLARDRDRELASGTVAALLERVVGKGWLRALNGEHGGLAFAPARPYDEALVLSFRKFLYDLAIDRPEALAVLRSVLEQNGEATTS